MQQVSAVGFIGCSTSHNLQAWQQRAYRVEQTNFLLCYICMRKFFPDFLHLLIVHAYHQESCLLQWRLHGLVIIL